MKRGVQTKGLPEVSFRQSVMLSAIKNQILEDDFFLYSDEDFAYLESGGFIFVDNDHSYPSTFLTELGEQVLAQQSDSIPNDFDYEEYFRIN